jgi:hypothetical protein
VEPPDRMRGQLHQREGRREFRMLTVTQWAGGVEPFVIFFVNELCGQINGFRIAANRPETAYCETANQRAPIGNFLESWIFRSD